MKPRSNCMPSTTSSAVSVVLDSSTVMTPSLPTFSMASATSSPMTRIIMGRDRCHLRLFLALLDRPRQSLNRFDGRLGASVEAALDVYGAGAGDHIAHAIGKYRMCQDGRRAGAIADRLAGLLGGLPQHLRAEILLGILEVELLGDGHAVIADDRHTPFLLDQHGLGFWPQRHPDCIGKLGRAAENFFARGRAK